MTRFRDVTTRDTFDWINPETPGQNSFFERCWKTGPRTYRALNKEADKLYGMMKVGSINAKVFNVKGPDR